MTTLKVLWPYITIKVRNDMGQTVLRELYAGAPVPDNADPDDVARLVRKGALVEEGTLAGDVFAVPAGTPIPGEPPNVPVTEQPANSGHLDERLRRQQEAVDSADQRAARPEGQPAPYASKGAWVNYAVSRRADGVSEEDARAEAESKSKADLIHDHGDQPADQPADEPQG